MITIITAAWNLDGLKRTIKSIDNQTYKDWNHIIVNDGNENIRKELSRLCDGNKRRWIDLGFRTHYYGGLARNIGVITSFSYMHHSKRDIDNEWVVFHDDDNYWAPEHLKSMIDASTGLSEPSMVASDAIWMGSRDKDWQREVKCTLKHGGCDLGQFMYKTKLFRKYGYFFPHPRRKHKYDWELIKKMTDGEVDKISYTNKPTFIMNYKKR